VVGWFAKGIPFLALASDAEGDVAASEGGHVAAPSESPNGEAAAAHFYPCVALTGLSHREPEPLLAITAHLGFSPLPLFHC
jgi:hypothetical protein